MSKRWRKVLGFVFFAFLCSGGCIGATIVRCEWMNTVPKAPVYPNSVLVRQVLNGVKTSRYPLATYYYTSTDAPESIIVFYEEHGNCGQGDASSPFGEYFVGVNVSSYETQEITSFWIEIRWKGCTWDLE